MDSPSSPNSGSVSSLLEENLNSGKKKKGKRSLILSNRNSGVFLDVINDDELEKKKRKEEAEQLEKEAKEKNRRNVLRPYNLLSNLSPTELEDHFSQCIKMCNQNKVNPKNAFKLQLIDYMKLIITKKSAKTENLSLMSCTLDASAKIYSFRVDKVYSDMMTIMSGKIWTKGGDSETAMDDDDQGDNNEDETPRKKKKNDKACMNGKIDFEKMLWSEVRLDKSEMEVSNNYKYTRSLLPSNAEYFLDCPISETDGQMLLNGQVFNSAEINCSDKVLKDFAHKYRGNFTSVDPAESIPGYEKMYPESSKPEIVVNNHLIYDKNSDLIPEAIRSAGGDNSCNRVGDISLVDYDDCMSDDDDDVGVEPTPLAPNNTTKVGQITASKTSFSVNGLSRFVTSRRSEYSFFDNNRFKFMAGPVHWSIKTKKNKTNKQSDAPKTCKKDGFIKFDVNNMKKLSKMFKENVNAELCPKTLTLWCKTDHTLPSTVYNQNNIFVLNNDGSLTYLTEDFKNGLFKKNKVTDDLSQSLTPENFIDHNDNERNNSGGHSDEDIRDDYDDNHCDASMADATSHNLLNTTTLDQVNGADELELIPAPPLVNKIFIKYAKTQKRLDIRLLKNTIWETMALDKKENNSEPTKAVQIYSALPEKLPNEESEQLNFPLLFMAMLHLANEKNLKLTGNDEHNDITISLD